MEQFFFLSFLSFFFQQTLQNTIPWYEIHLLPYSVKAAKAASISSNSSWNFLFISSTHILGW